MIRQATPADRADILDIYAIARDFMKSAGNPSQWGDTFPPVDSVDRTISQGICHVVELDGRLQAVFTMETGEDPTYLVIDGAWLNDAPYAAVHRVASRGEVKGLTNAILDWAMERHANIRIDTHADNIPMQRCLARAGFTPCGTISAWDGTPRIAYQKCRA